MTAGTDTALVLIGSAFTNISGRALYSSNVSLTASDGSSVVLTPKGLDENTIEVTIPAATAAGSYTLRAVKTDSAGNPTKSNPVSFIVLPRVHIAEVYSPETTAMIGGGGFSGYAAGSGTAVIGARRNGSGWVTEEATIISWSDTTIVAGFEARPDYVTVHSIFGSVTSAVTKKPDKRPGNDD